MLYLKCTRGPEIMTNHAACMLTIDNVWTANFSDFVSPARIVQNQKVPSSGEGFGKMNEFFSVDRRVINVLGIKRRFRVLSTRQVYNITITVCPGKRISLIMLSVSHI